MGNRNHAAGWTETVCTQNETVFGIESAIYAFRKSRTNKRKYILTSRTGRDVLPLGVCKRGPDKGSEFILLEETGTGLWTHSLYTTAAVAIEAKRRADGGEPSRVRIAGFDFREDELAFSAVISPFFPRIDLVAWLFDDTLGVHARQWRFI